MSDDFLIKLLGKFETVPIASIDIDSNNHREIDYAHIDELAKSIRERGLINPITLYHPPHRVRYYILAGRHRFHAMKALQHEVISARVYDYELSDYELRVIELYENLHRKELTGPEKDQQIAQLHKLMQQIKGPSTTGSNARGHRITDTARLVGRSVGSVVGSLKMDEAIRNLPELGLDKIAKRSDALRILQRFASVISNQHIVEQTSTQEDPLLTSYITGDFFANALPSESFAIIECDPPYGIDLSGLKKSADSAAIRTDYNEIPAQDYPDFMHKLCQECYRLASPSSWFILWFGIQHYNICSAALQSVGFVHHPTPAIWKKGNSPGQTNAADSVLGNAYEAFLWARKGSPKLHQKGRSNIFDYPMVPQRQKIHPTERPVMLVTDILRTFAWPGMQVLCPFLGSGNTLLAAKELGMPAVGFELTENYRNAFVARLEKNK